MSAKQIKRRNRAHNHHIQLRMRLSWSIFVSTSRVGLRRNVNVVGVDECVVLIEIRRGGNYQPRWHPFLQNFTVCQWNSAHANCKNQTKRRGDEEKRQKKFSRIIHPRFIQVHCFNNLSSTKSEQRNELCRTRLVLLVLFHFFSHQGLPDNLMRVDSRRGVACVGCQ